MAKLPLTVDTAARLYRKGWAACRIAESYGVSRLIAENKIRSRGLAGLQWCATHGMYEELGPAR